MWRFKRCKKVIRAFLTIKKKAGVMIASCPLIPYQVEVPHDTPEVNPFVREFTRAYRMLAALCVAIMMLDRHLDEYSDRHLCSCLP